VTDGRRKTWTFSAARPGGRFPATSAYIVDRNCWERNVWNHAFRAARLRNGGMAEDSGRQGPCLFKNPLSDSRVQPRRLFTKTAIEWVSSSPPLGRLRRDASPGISQVSQPGVFHYPVNVDSAIGSGATARFLPDWMSLRFDILEITAIREHSWAVCAGLNGFYGWNAGSTPFSLGEAIYNICETREGFWKNQHLSS